MARRLVLASSSASRLRVLRLAGIEPLVVPSGVDEANARATRPGELVLELAERKALAVANGRDDLVLGCDSLLDLDGVALGKPETSEEALRRWRAMRGRAGELRTGHVLVDGQTGSIVREVVSTTVHFGSPSDEELDAYIATGEPLGVAGAFTLEGRSAPFIDGVVGDAGNVLGLSLPALRRLLGRLGLAVTELWEPAAAPPGRSPRSGGAAPSS